MNERCENPDKTQSLLKHERDALKAHFDESEDQALDALERLYNLYPEIIHLSEYLFYFSDRKETPLYFAARVNYDRVVERLIEMGVDLNKGVYYYDSNHLLHLASPLLTAAHEGSYESCEILLKKNANILRATCKGLSALMLTRYHDVTQLLLETSRDKGCLQHFVSLKSHEGFTAVDFQFHYAKPGNVLELTNILATHDKSATNKILRRARMASVTSPEKSVKFDAVCERLRSDIKVRAPMTLSTHATKRLTRRSAYYELFKSELPADSKLSFEDTKTQAIKSLIAQYYELLNSPEQCMHYLRFLNDELKRYYQHKYQESFPELDKSGVEFQPIRDLYYPIPKPGYKGIKKNRALAEFLIALFRKHGLAEKAYKWIGFIPQELADEHVKKGYFFTEGNNGTGLCHGKLAHMLQRVLLIYAIEDGRIDRSFMFNGKRPHINFDDIYEALLSLKGFDGKRLWTWVQDKRVTKQMQFADPFQLVSIIMYEGHNQGLDALADSLTDSFCKGFNTYLKAYQLFTPFTDISPPTFAQHISDLNLTVFNFYAPLFNTEVEKTLQKRKLRIEEIDSGQRYALPPKNYDLDPLFEPGDYKAYITTLIPSPSPS